VLFGVPAEETESNDLCVRETAELGIAANLLKQATLRVIEHDPVRVPFLVREATATPA